MRYSNCAWNERFDFWENWMRFDLKKVIIRVYLNVTYMLNNIGRVYHLILFHSLFVIKFFNLKFIFEKF